MFGRALFPTLENIARLSRGAVLVVRCGAGPSS